MRARYSAYFFRLLEFLVETTHPDSRTPKLAAELEEHLYDCMWRKLRILETSKGGKEDKRGKVKFVAQYDIDRQAYELREHSRFKRFKGDWKYLDDKG